MASFRMKDKLDQLVVLSDNKPRYADVKYVHMSNGQMFGRVANDVGCPIPVKRELMGVWTVMK